MMIMMMMMMMVVVIMMMMVMTLASPVTGELDDGIKQLVHILMGLRCFVEMLCWRKGH